MSGKDSRGPWGDAGLQEQHFLFPTFTSHSLKENAVKKRVKIMCMDFRSLGRSL